MTLTKLEKITIIFLISTLVLGLILIVIQIKGIHAKNAIIEEDLKQIAALTSREVPKKIVSQVDQISEKNKINVNLADLKQLDAIPGIGKVMAQRIIDFRNQKGKIDDLSQLLEIKGMSPKKLSNLSQYLSVSGEAKTVVSPQKKLNLNFATVEELEALPGIGRKLAEAIVKTRNKKGTFYSLNDLEEVPGLTESKFRAFEHLVEVK